jgi:hypothetical protein
MQYECNGAEVIFQLPDGSFAVVAKTDSCRITAGGFAQIDSTSLVRFADLLITQYRRSLPVAPYPMVVRPPSDVVPVPGPVPGPAPGPEHEPVAATVAAAGEVCLKRAALAPWRSVCAALPPTGGRGIKNPGCLCYMNAALAALSACPQYGEQVRKLSLLAPGHFVVSRLSALFRDLNDCTQPALDHVDKVMDNLTLSLVSANCPIPITDHRKMQDSSMLVNFILTAANTQFTLHDPDDYRKIIESSCLMPTLPPRKKDGDDWISLEDCVDRMTLAQQAPVLLPIWLRRVGCNGETQWKISRACRPPLIMEVRVCGDDGVKKIPYYLRSVILHHGDSPDSGHYTSVVPLIDGLDHDSQYPFMWQIRNDSNPEVVKLSDKLLTSIFHESVCFMYEKSPFV